MKVDQVIAKLLRFLVFNKELPLQKSIQSTIYHGGDSNDATGVVSETFIFNHIQN